MNPAIPGNLRTNTIKRGSGAIKERKAGVKKTAILSFLFLFAFLNLTGCVPVLIGGGALGAYAISKDTIQGDTDKPYDLLWTSALSVSRIRGTIKQQDASKGYIQLAVESGFVWIRLFPVTQSTTRLRVSARKYHFPNIDLAQDMFIKIMEGAK